MAYESKKNNGSNTNYERDIKRAEKARNNTMRDTDPAYEKNGCLYMDDLDKLRRDKLKNY